jgi:hypothetical protein
MAGVFRAAFDEYKYEVWTDGCGFHGSRKSKVELGQHNRGRESGAESKRARGGERARGADAGLTPRLIAYGASEDDFQRRS